MKTEVKPTPMIQQYRRIKKSIPKDCILMFRLGDFYEMFFEDAKIASKILNITLTSRSREEGKNYPMCGIPYHAADSYIGKLIKAGYKVAVCDQVEDPKLVKGIVKREVTRIITPGTVLDDQFLESKSNNYLFSFYKLGGLYGISFLDISTGEFRCTEFPSEEEFFSEYIRINPSECILPESFRNTPLQARMKESADTCIFNFYEDWLFDYDNAYNTLKELFKVHSLDGFGCNGMLPAISAAGSIIHYLKENLHTSLAHIQFLIPYTPGEYMLLDSATVKNLELIESIDGSSRKATLLGIMDFAKTSMGGRLLKNWILRPLNNSARIRRRQEAVKELYIDTNVIQELQDILSCIPDLERLLSRVDSGRTSPRDLVGIKNALKHIPEIVEKLGKFESEYIKEIVSSLKLLPNLVELLDKALIDNPPNVIRDGGFIKDGHNEELDELRGISRNAKEWITQLQMNEIKRTGIKSLRVGYNKVFGYYIEVSKPNLASVPEDYIRKQTLVNTERFITPQLKEYESKVLNAQEEIKELEIKLFHQLREEIIKHTPQIQSTARGLAQLDVLLSFALLAKKKNYIFPEINEEPVIRIEEGQHPVLAEFMEEGKRFVPNDVLIDSSENQLLIITGPNMAGKSTYIRQVALLTLMAQIGSPIPAKSATIGVVDRIFTRVGASDRLSRGQSTFMVEMNETAYILNNATPRSLIILDEIGRGTSTYDGISIAWAIAEYLISRKSTEQKEGFQGPKTLFATHYHELTELARIYPDRVKNYNILVREWNDEVVFLYKIVPGGTDKSYGVHVARLAGLPTVVIERAKDILNKLEQGTFFELRKKTTRGHMQMELFKNNNIEILEEIKRMDLDYLTPIEALNRLKEIKDRLTHG